MVAVVATVRRYVSRPPLRKKHLLPYHAWDAHRCWGTECFLSSWATKAGRAKARPCGHVPLPLQNEAAHPCKPLNVLHKQPLTGDATAKASTEPGAERTLSKRWPGQGQI